MTVEFADLPPILVSSQPFAQMMAVMPDFPGPSEGHWFHRMGARTPAPSFPSPWLDIDRLLLVQVFAFYN